MIHPARWYFALDTVSFIYGNLLGWPLERCARFATAQASLKCGAAGYQLATILEGERLAATLQVDAAGPL